jgi:hypothetical protein
LLGRGAALWGVGRSLGAGAWRQPTRSFEANRARWLKAAGGLLERHPRVRLDQALAYMVTDEILGSEALTMPGFAKVAEKLIARAHARQLRLSARGATGVGERGLGWQDAKGKLERSIQRHGRDGREAALRELARENSLLLKFVERVRWRELCEQPLRYAERKYAEIWAEIAQQANETRERSA